MIDTKIWPILVRTVVRVDFELVSFFLKKKLTVLLFASVFYRFLMILQLRATYFLSNTRSISFLIILR